MLSITANLKLIASRQVWVSRSKINNGWLHWMPKPFYFSPRNVEMINRFWSTKCSALHSLGSSGFSFKITDFYLTTGSSWSPRSSRSSWCPWNCCKYSSLFSKSKALPFSDQIYELSPNQSISCGNKFVCLTLNQV